MSWSSRPANGTRPESNLYSTTPSWYTSVRVVTGSPRICSGDAYSGVIQRLPVRTSAGTVSGSTSFASPKSSNFTVPSRVTGCWTASDHGERRGLHAHDRPPRALAERVAVAVARQAIARGQRCRWVDHRCVPGRDKVVPPDLRRRRVTGRYRGAPGVRAANLPGGIVPGQPRYRARG